MIFSFQWKIVITVWKTCRRRMGISSALIGPRLIQISFLKWIRAAHWWKYRIHIEWWCRIRLKITVIFGIYFFKNWSFLVIFEPIVNCSGRNFFMGQLSLLAFIQNRRFFVKILSQNWTILVKIGQFQSKIGLFWDKNGIFWSK